MDEIEVTILTILSDMDEDLLLQCERIIKEFNESKIAAKQSMIPGLASQFYSMLPAETQELYVEIFHNLAQQGVPLIKKKVCQSLHEGGFLERDEIISMVEQFLKDPSE